MIEEDKLDRIRRVVSHNGGEILSEVFVENGIHMKVRKAAGPGDL